MITCLRSTWTKNLVRLLEQNKNIYKLHLVINNLLIFVFYLNLLIIFFAGRPFPLQSCTVSNRSIDSLDVDCVEGFNGGLPQGFMLELVQMSTLKVVRNMSLVVSLLLFNIRFSISRFFNFFISETTCIILYWKFRTWNFISNHNFCLQCKRTIRADNYWWYNAKGSWKICWYEFVKLKFFKDKFLLLIYWFLKVLVQTMNFFYRLFLRDYQFQLPSYLLWYAL